MKKGIAIVTALTCAGALSASADVVIAGWDNFNSGTAPTATVFAAGITGTGASAAFSNGSSEDRGSSSDTTWGSFDGNGEPADATIVGSVNLTAHNGEDADLTLTIVNNGTDDLDLAAFHMDALAFRPNAARTYVLSVESGSDITVGNVFSSASQVITHLGGTAPNAAQDQHDEIDLSLAGLADHTLEVGGTAILKIAFSGGTDGSSGHHLWIDNIAVSGTVIPEPATLGLVAAFGGGVMFIRRRFML